MIDRNRDLLLILGVACGAASLQWIPSVEPALVYWIAGAYLALISPGLAWSRALYIETISHAGRFAVVLGLSLISIIIGGLLLQFTPVGLRPTSWAILLVLITLLGCIAAALRRSASVPGRSTMAGIELDLATTKTHSGHLRHILGFICAALLMAVAVFIAFTGARQAQEPGFTILWAVPAGSPGAVDVGVSNREDSSAAYLLRLKSGGAGLLTRQIVLDRSSSWKETIVVPAGSIQPLEFELFRAERRDVVYRRVTLYQETSGRYKTPTQAHSN